MDRICPFLALSLDHRTAVDGFDPDHFCHAIDPAEAVDRQRQAEQCLVEAHRQCDRYAAFLTARAAAAPDIPTPAADAQLARTRMVVELEARRGGARSLAPVGMSPRRWLIAGGAAAVGVAAAATAFGGGFNALGQRPAAGGAPTTPTPTQQPTQPATPQPEPTGRPSPEPQRSTPEPTSRPRNSPSAAPQPVTYVVRAGDTLTTIANQFGTSVQAIQQANGLGSDVINIGQVLVIP